MELSLKLYKTYGAVICDMCGLGCLRHGHFTIAANFDVATPSCHYGGVCGECV